MLHACTLEVKINDMQFMPDSYLKGWQKIMYYYCICHLRIELQPFGYAFWGRYVLYLLC